MVDPRKPGRPTTRLQTTPAPSNTRGWIWILACFMVLGGLAYMASGREGAVPAAVRPSPANQAASITNAAPDQSPGATAPAPAEPPSQPASSGTPAKRSNLQVTRMSPTKVTFNYRDTPIEVEFSRPVNPDTVPPAFRVNPPMDGTFSWPAPNRLVFTPNKLWDQAGTYRVTLETGVTDLNGLDQLEATSWTFSTVGGYSYTRDILPLVKAYCVSCHRQDGPASRIPLETHAGAMQFIRPGDAGGSRFFVALTDGNHAGKVAPQVVSKSYLIHDWITMFQAID